MQNMNKCYITIFDIAYTVISFSYLENTSSMLLSVPSLNSEILRDITKDSGHIKDGKKKVLRIYT